MQRHLGCRHMFTKAETISRDFQIIINFSVNMDWFMPNSDYFAGHIIYFLGTRSFLNHNCTVFLCTLYDCASSPKMKSVGDNPVNPRAFIKSLKEYSIFIELASN